MMAWIELTITVGEIQAVRDMRSDDFIARALASAGFELETKLGRKLLAEPYQITRHPLDYWITYRQWQGPGDPAKTRPFGDTVKGPWACEDGGGLGPS
jgi:hypothetical protein